MPRHTPRTTRVRGRSPRGGEEETEFRRGGSGRVGPARGPPGRTRLNWFRSWAHGRREAGVQKLPGYRAARPVAWLGRIKAECRTEEFELYFLVGRGIPGRLVGRCL
jgi:hypothetical protein